MKRAKKSVKKVFCLTLCLALCLSLFAACGKKQEENKENASGTQDKQSEQNQNDTGNTDKSDTNGENTTPDDAGQDGESADGETAGSGITFPLAEKAEISVWVPWSSPVCDSPDEVGAVRVMEERTNVHINWTTAGSNEASEKFGLMMASGNYPDVLCNAGGYYSGSITAGLEDGVFLDLTDIIEANMPNYTAIITSNPEYDKMTKLDDGRRGAVYQVNCYNMERIEGENPWIGSVVRKDWLDKLNLELPETIDDWHEVLTAFKENYGAVMILNSTGINWAQDFISAYGVLSGFFQKDGTAYFGPLEEGYKQYLATMQQWYQEGLIDPNFNSFNLWTDTNRMFANNEAGAGSIIGSSAYSYLKDSGMTNEEGFFLQTVPAPVLNEGDTSYIGMSIPVFSRHLVLSTNCKNPELVLSYLDQYFTEEGMEISSYGVEGESYAKKQDGSYEFLPVVKENPEGLSPADACSKYTMMAGQYFGFYNWGYAPPLYGEWLNEAQGIWKTDDSMNMPTNMTMTPEETIEYYTYYTDIQTLVEEFTAKCIMGSETLENYDSFVDSLKSYGVEKCLKIQQAALDRYNTR